MRILVSATVTMSGSFDQYIEAESMEDAEEIAAEMVESIDVNDVDWNEEVELYDDYDVIAEDEAEDEEDDEDEEEVV